MDHSDWDRRYAEREQLWSGEPHPLLAEVAAPLTPGRALDLGSGEGADAVWLAEHGWTVTAVDFSEVALERARAAAASRALRLSWVRADLRSYLPPAGSFDLVTLLYIHFPPEARRALLGRAATALAPGGTLLVVGHDVTNEGHGPRRPDVLFTAETIASELGGLSIVRAERIARPAELDGRQVRAVDALVVARRPA